MLDSSKIMNVSEFFTSNISPTLLGAFLRRTEYIESKYLFAYFSYRKSRFAEFDEETYSKYLTNINLNSGEYPYWQLNESENGDEIYIKSSYNGVYILKNDLGLDASDEGSGNNFTNRLINKIRAERFSFDYAMEKERKDFLRGYLDIAMSYDGSGLLACDYYCQKKSDIKKINVIMDCGLMNPEYFNFNTRLTTDTTQKADQFRISWKYYLNQIGTYNHYRLACICAADTTANGLDIIVENGVERLNIDYVAFSEQRKNEKIVSFVTKYQQFLNIAYGYRIEGNTDEESIKSYRLQFGIDEGNREDRKKSRSQRIVNQVYDDEPDLCVCCQNKYDIKDRSFLKPRRINNQVIDKYYFETHHAISFSNGQDSDSSNNVLDVIENLVKVCPTCHACMTSKRGRVEDIKELILSMIRNSTKVREFAEGYFGTATEENLVEKIFEYLH